MRSNNVPVRRLIWTGTIAAALVGTAVMVPSTSGWRDGDLASIYDASQGAQAERLPHVDPADGHGHDHDDPSTKNAVSRAGETGKDAQDPTTSAERAANAAYVARNRQTPDPELTTAPATYRPPKVPQTRYAMARGCYSLAGTPCASRPPTSAPTCSTPRTGSSSAPTASPPRRRRAPTGRLLRRVTASRSGWSTTRRG